MNKYIKAVVTAVLWLAISLSTYAQTTVEYIHTDALGTPIAVTDANKVVIETTEYEPYGAQVAGPVKDGPGYTGHVQDAATGLTYMQQRYYDPQVGLFLSVDPVTAYDGNVRHFSRYTYAYNNPFSFIDPDGRSPLDDNPDRQPRGGTMNNGSSPGASQVNMQKNGGAPTATLQAQMQTGNAEQRTELAKSAMAIAGIKGNPSDVSYNADLKGIASGITDPTGAVEVGPDSFTTWSELTSTLGHEFEIHAPDFQSFGPIKNQQDNDARETRAHQYNLDNGSRFRNTPAEMQRHRQYRDSYKHRLEENRK